MSWRANRYQNNIRLDSFWSNKPASNRSSSKINFIKSNSNEITDLLQNLYDSEFSDLISFKTNFSPVDERAHQIMQNSPTLINGHIKSNCPFIQTPLISRATTRLHIRDKCLFDDVLSAMTNYIVNTQQLLSNTRPKGPVQNRSTIQITTGGLNIMESR